MREISAPMKPGEGEMDRVRLERGNDSRVSIPAGRPTQLIQRFRNNRLYHPTKPAIVLPDPLPSRALKKPQNGQMARDGPR
jgi:hypothetical protein